jgi:hypothetical protein
VTDASATETALTPRWRVRITMVVGRVLFGSLYRVKVVGRTRVPPTGPVVFVANHVGFLDGPMLPPSPAPHVAAGQARDVHDAAGVVPRPDRPHPGDAQLR